MAGRTKGNKPGSRMDIIPDFGNIVFLALCFKDKSCSAAQKVVTNRLFLKQALEDCKDEIYNNLGKSRTEKPVTSIQHINTYISRSDLSKLQERYKNEFMVLQKNLK